MASSATNGPTGGKVPGAACAGLSDHSDPEANNVASVASAPRASLPSELLAQALSWLPPAGLKCCRLVCRAWQDVVDDPLVVGLLRSRLHEEFLPFVGLRPPKSATKTSNQPAPSDQPLRQHLAKLMSMAGFCNDRSSRALTICRVSMDGNTAYLSEATADSLYAFLLRKCADGSSVLTERFRPGRSFFAADGVHVLVEGWTPTRLGVVARRFVTPWQFVEGEGSAGVWRKGEARERASLNDAWYGRIRLSVEGEATTECVGWTVRSRACTGASESYYPGFEHSYALWPAIRFPTEFKWLRVPPQQAVVEPLPPADSAAAKATACTARQAFLTWVFEQGRLCSDSDGNPAYNRPPRLIDHN